MQVSYDVVQLTMLWLYFSYVAGQISYRSQTYISETCIVGIGFSLCLSPSSNHALELSGVDDHRVAIDVAYL